MYNFIMDELSDTTDKLENIYSNLIGISTSIEEILHKDNNTYSEVDLEEYVDLLEKIEPILKNMKTNQILLNNILSIE